MGVGTGATVTRKVDGLKGLAERLKNAKKMEVAVGFPKDMGNAYPDGTPVVEVAAAHVFGVGVIQRDFMALARPKIIENVKPILKQIALLISRGDQNDVKAVEALFKAIGEMGIAEIRAAIIDGAWPPNSGNPMSPQLRERISRSWGIDIPEGMSYLEAKMKYHGSDKPLVDTGHMVQAVTAVVRDRS